MRGIELSLPGGISPSAGSPGDQGPLPACVVTHLLEEGSPGIRVLQRMGWRCHAMMLKQQLRLGVQPSHD